MAPKSNSFILFVALIQIKSAILCELVVKMHTALRNGTSATREAGNTYNSPGKLLPNLMTLTNDLKVYKDSSKGEKSKHINLNALNSHMNFLMQE